MSAPWDELTDSEKIERLQWAISEVSGLANFLRDEIRGLQARVEQLEAERQSPPNPERD